ncbi:MAG: 4Fe-4S binding protein [Syntrophomonadaceae bacterium]|nr:4Fe-4S binding protein [Syntrophomonadaceae bacterium]
MNDFTNKAREIAKRLLADGTVSVVLGWEKGDEPYASAPTAITELAEVDRLIIDEYCIHEIAALLTDYRDGTDKVAIFAKGCDVRGIIRMIQDRVIPRERLHIIGINCPGMKDPNEYARAASGFGKAPAAEIAAKCQVCQNPNPFIYDEIIGDLQKVEPSNERFASVEEIEKMTPDERYNFFAQELSKCIRCYACRNACVACNCRTCIFDESKPQWVGRSTDTVNNMLYHIIRATHVAGRCVECGECERVCPVGIPLMLLNRKLVKDVDELFGPYQAGLSLEDDAIPPLSRYRVDDPDEFM